jgi:nuclear pore complex protein Nup133
MKHEDKLLHQFVEKNRLSQWVHTTFEAVRAELDRTLDTATKNTSAVDTDKVMAGSIFDTDMSVDASPVGRF